MIEANPAGLIQWAPELMARHGKVPVSGGRYNGANLYRLIWAPSREVTLCLDCGRRNYPLYVSVEPLKNPFLWVLEKWLPVDKVTSATRAEWEADPTCLLSGPYPADGDYVMAGPPLTCEPANANIDKLIMWIEAGERFTPGQNALAIQNKIDADEKTKRRVIKDKIDDRCLPFGGEAWASGTSVRSKRNTKTINVKHSARDLGLPVKSGYTGVSPVHKPVRYKVPIHDED